MSQEKYYSIIVGRKEPQMAEAGFLNKDTGLPDRSKGTLQKVAVPVGKYLVPNFYRTWGRRISEGNTSTGKSKADEGKVSVTDPRYRGKIEFLPWGAAGGEVIEIRYLQSSASLDRQFQDQVLKIKTREDEAFLFLEPGINDFDYTLNENKIIALKYHSMNLDSPSKDPSNGDWDFIEYNGDAMINNREKAIVLRNTATAIVLEAKKTPGQLTILAHIFGLDPQSQEGVIYDTLLTKAEEFSAKFIEVYQDYQRELQLKLIDAKEAGVLKLEEPGITAWISGKPELILAEVPAEDSADAKILYLASNIIEPEVFDAVQKILTGLTEYTDSL